MNLLPAPKEHKMFPDDMASVKDGELYVRCIEALRDLIPTDKQVIDAYMTHRYVDWTLGMQLRGAEVVSRHWGDGYSSGIGTKIKDELQPFLDWVNNEIHSQMRSAVQKREAHQLSVLQPSCEVFHSIDTMNMLRSTSDVFRPVVLHILARNGQREHFDKYVPATGLWQMMADATTLDLYGMMKVQLSESTNIRPLTTHFVTRTLLVVIQTHLQHQEYWNTLQLATHSLNEVARKVFRENKRVGSYLLSLKGEKFDVEDPMAGIATTLSNVQLFNETLDKAASQEIREDGRAFFQMADDAIFNMLASEGGLVDSSFFTKQVELIDYHLNLVAG